MLASTFVFSTFIYHSSKFSTIDNSQAKTPQKVGVRRLINAKSNGIGENSLIEGVVDVLE
jgi:hypothetical protein